MAFEGIFDGVSSGDTRGDSVDLAREKRAASPRNGEAFVEGFGRSASFGLLPLLQRAVASGVDYFADPGRTSELESQGFKVQEQSNDDYFRKRAIELEKEAPIASIAGQAAGALTTPAVASLRAAGAIGGGVRGAALAGGLEGFLTGTGAGGTGIDLGDRLSSGLIGAATGGGFASIGSAARGTGRFLKEGADIAKEKINSLFLSKLGRPTAEHVRSILKDKAGLADFAVKNKIIEATDDVADIAIKAKSANNRIGAQLGEFYRNLSATAAEKGKPLSKAATLRKIRVAINRSAKKIDLGSEQLDDVVREFASKIRRHKGPLTASDLHDLAVSVNRNKINWADPAKTVSNKGYMFASEKISSILKKHAKDVLGEGSLKGLRGLNKDYGRSKILLDMAKRGEEKTLAKQITELAGTKLGGSGLGGTLGAISEATSEDPSLYRIGRNFVIGAGAGLLLPRISRAVIGSVGRRAIPAQQVLQSVLGSRPSQLAGRGLIGLGSGFTPRSAYLAELARKALSDMNENKRR